MPLRVIKQNGQRKQAAAKIAKKASELNNALELVMEACMHETVHCPQHLNTHYRPFSPEVYGETSYKVIAEILKKLKTSRNDIFLDLGSGLGQVVLQVAGSIQCKFAYGIEVGELPFNISTGLLSRYKASMKDKGMRHGQISLFLGNFLEARFRKMILSATIIFVNNLVFGPKLNNDIANMLSEIKHDVTVISSNEFYLGRDRSSRPVSFEVVDEVKGNVSWTGKKVTYFIQKLKRNSPSPSTEIPPDSVFEPSVNCQDAAAVADSAVNKVEAAAGDDAGSHDRIPHEVNITAAELNLKLKEVVNYLKTSSSTSTMAADPDVVELNATMEELSALLRERRPVPDVAVAHARQSDPYKVEMRVIMNGKVIRRGRYIFHSDETKIQKFLNEHQREWKGNTRNDENKVVVKKKRKISRSHHVPVRKSVTLGKLEQLLLDLVKEDLESESDAGINWEEVPSPVPVEDGDVAQSEPKPNETVWRNTALGERVFARSKNYEYEYARIIRKELGLDCTWRVKFIGKISSEETNVSFRQIFPISEFGVGTEVTYVGDGDLLNWKSAKVIGHKRLKNPETGSIKVQHEIECDGTTLCCSHEEIVLTENQANAIRKLTDRFYNTAVRKDIQAENIVESRTRSGRKPVIVMSGSGEKEVQASEIN